MGFACARFCSARRDPKVLPLGQGGASRLGPREGEPVEKLENTLLDGGTCAASLARESSRFRAARFEEPLEAYPLVVCPE